MECRFPNNLKKHRRIAALSQTQVAAILGYENSSCLCLWEKGRSLPGVRQLFELSILYQASPIDLFDELYQSISHKLFAHREPIINNDTGFVSP